MNFLRGKNNYGDYKYCPVCGSPSKLTDAYCMRCGHSFNKSNISRKRMKLKNIILVIAAIALFYFGLRYTAGQALVPTSLADALNISFNFKK